MLEPVEFQLTMDEGVKLGEDDVEGKRERAEFEAIIRRVG